MSPPEDSDLNNSAKSVAADRSSPTGSSPTEGAPEHTSGDPPRRPTLRQNIAGFTYRTLRWGRDRVPPGIRTIVGLLFCVGGVFGFLPILGFWMLPLGIAFIALDIPPARSRIDKWMTELRATARGES